MASGEFWASYGEGRGQLSPQCLPNNHRPSPASRLLLKVRKALASPPRLRTEIICIYGIGLVPPASSSIPAS